MDSLIILVIVPCFMMAFTLLIMLEDYIRSRWMKNMKIKRGFYEQP